MADGLNPMDSAGISPDLWRHVAGAAKAAEAKAGAGDKARAVQAAKDFESVLLHQLLSEMRKSVPDSGLLSDGTSDQMESMFWMFLSRHMADQGGLGLWKEIYRQAVGPEESTQTASTVEQLL